VQQGILSGHEIRREVQEGTILIEPYKDSRVNPASYDLSLGAGVKVYRRTCIYTPSEYEDGTSITPSTKRLVLDAKDPQSWETWDFEIPRGGWMLRPGICYLMHTEERIKTDIFVPILDGKSSLGRMFVKVHETAGYGDPGFDGQYTLEVTCQFPVKVYAGMRFCQIRFHTLRGEPLLYQDKGRYTGTRARGAVATRIYEQFD